MLEGDLRGASEHSEDIYEPPLTRPAGPVAPWGQPSMVTAVGTSLVWR